MPKKLTQEQFLIRAKEVHSDTYNYSLVNYVNNRTIIQIICNQHGIFDQNPVNHLNNQGCPSCASLIRNNKLSNLNRKDLKFYLDKANIIHDNFYNYELVEYTTSVDKVKIICPFHGVFEQTFNAHVNQNKGCSLCADNLLVDNESFIIKAMSVHNNLYDYSLVNYTGAHNKIEIICKEHDVFKQAPNVHLKGHGCPRCVSSISKIEIKWFDYVGLSHEFRHQTIRFNNKYYLVDGFDPNTNTVYEFYGDYWHGNPKIYDSNLIHPVRKVSFGKLYTDTIRRENMIKNAGYNLIFIWESDFKLLFGCSTTT